MPVVSYSDGVSESPFPEPAQLKGIIRRMLRQTAVYWHPLGRNAEGERLFTEPGEIKCRWEDTNVEYQRGSGETAVSESRVYVDRDLLRGGYLFLGTLDDAPVNPENNNDCHPIYSVQKMPDARSRQFLRTVML